MTKISPKNKKTLSRLLQASPLTWVLAGFALTYLLFFIRPLFFSAPAMRNPEPLPIHETIGLDLEQMLSYSHAWLMEKSTPYIGNNLYPPLATVLFSPLLYLDFATAYRLITILTVVSFVFTIVLLTREVKGQPYMQAIVLLILVTGLVSYGLQYEIERGQFWTISYATCFYGLWLFHRRPKQRIWAYVLFTLAVQIKVTPLLFILLLVDDWRDWKANLTRFTGLGAANIALLLVLGLDIFKDFLQGITAQALAPDVWNGNHSIHAFTTFLLHYADYRGWALVVKLGNVIEAGFMLLVVACIGVVLLRLYRRNQDGISPALLAACALGTLLLPSLSNDYKLPLIAAPVALWLSSLDFSGGGTPPRLKLFRIELLLLFSLAYSSTLYSYTHKPITFSSNTPALLIMLLCIALYEWGDNVEHWSR